MGDRNNKAQYAPLLQAASSEDEDDLYPLSFHSGTNNDTTPAHHEDVMMMTDLRSPPRPDHRVNSTSRPRNPKKKTCALVTAGCVLIFVVVIAAMLAYFRSEFDRGIVNDIVQLNPYGDWSTFYNDSASESSITLIDVDGDGLEDILVGVMQLEQYLNTLKLKKDNYTEKQACIKLGFRYPCKGQLLAVRGYDGKTLWSAWLRSGVLFVNCHDIDVNQDRKPDCIITGRESSVQAVELATGNTLWVLDAEDGAWSSHFQKTWNVYRPLILDDVDKDGVKDIMVTHGGDPDKEPKDHNRAAGRVIFLSGATGKPLGRYMEMPNSKETYMSPVSYTTANGSTYYLFGSGGETVPGDLMIVKDKDLQHYIMGTDSSQLAPASLHVLFRGKLKGVMLSPVLVDMTGDGTLDILMSAFEGVFILFDGETLKEIWRQELTGMESYSTPTPGHFDSDDKIDFMVTMGKGAWPKYSSAQVYIVSGKDGSILWQTKTQTIQMDSDLSLRTAGSKDAFLFRLIGRRGPADARTVENKPHGAAGAGRKRRHLGGGMDDDDDGEGSVPLDNSPESVKKICDENAGHYAESHLLCTDDLKRMESEFFFMDGQHARTPILLHSTMPEKYYYNVTVKNGEPHCHPQVSGAADKVSVCAISIPKSTTGAVGDVNGDGKPDLILLEAWVADTFTDRYSYLGTRSDLILSRISLDKALRMGKAVELKVEHLQEGLKGGSMDENWGKGVQFLRDKSQPWRQFMGSRGDGVYGAEKKRSGGV